MKRIKYQKKLVTIDSATAAGTTGGEKIQLDSSYQRCTGIQVHEISDGGIANGYFGVGFKDDNGVIHEVVHKDSFIGSNTSPDQKYKTFDIPIADGNKIDIQVYNPAALSTDLIIEVEFRIEDDRIAI